MLCIQMRNCTFASMIFDKRFMYININARNGNIKIQKITRLPKKSDYINNKWSVLRKWALFGSQSELDGLCEKRQFQSNSVKYTHIHFRCGKKRDTPKTHFVLNSKHIQLNSFANYRLAFCLHSFSASFFSGDFFAVTLVNARRYRLQFLCRPVSRCSHIAFGLSQLLT